MKRKCGLIRFMLTVLALVCVVSGQALSEAEETFEERLAQAEKVYYTQYAEMAALYGPREDWTLEQKAQLDRLMLKAGFWDIHAGVPTTSDISQEEALSLSVQEVLKDDRFTKEMLDRFTVYTNFWIFTDETVPSRWDFLLHSPEDLQEYGSYRVMVNSTSGEIIESYWQPERQYPDISSFGKPAFIAEQEFIVSYEQAQTIAREAVYQTFGQERGLTRGMLAGFFAHSWAYLLEVDDNTYWQIEVRSPDGALQTYYGGFEVVIDTQTGEVTDVREGGNG